MPDKKFSAKPVLERLKDFQRRSVEYIFQKMYLDEPASPRFLVADEVGLGKTMIARGLIAKALEHLDDKIDRIDIVYVCSNAAIAGQNIDRLNVVGSQGFTLPTRLTMLATQTKDLISKHINFVSLTPGTSLDLRSRGGAVWERALIHQLLSESGMFPATPLKNLLRGNVNKDNWKGWIQENDDEIDPSIKNDFIAKVKKNEPLLKQMQEAFELFGYAKKHVPWEQRSLARDVTAQLRRELAHASINTLEPDLVILDEFQRFRDLLDGSDEAADLAQMLFSFKDVRVLLLSATPYKMLTMDDEQSMEHYSDFMRTLEFLYMGDKGAIKGLEEEINQYRTALFRVGIEGVDKAVEAKQKVEVRLKRVMCRTERINMTVQRDAMVSEPDMPAPINAIDLHQAALSDRVAREVGALDPLEFWKSSPYMLNFMKNYDLKRKLEKVLDDPPQAVMESIRAAKPFLLDHEKIDAYERIDPGNARMRVLFKDVLDAGLWKLLWLPPSMPYYAPSGSYAEVGDITKVLVFSSWNIVPDAVGAMLSFEAERRMVEGMGAKFSHSELYDKVKPLLKFAREKEGRLTGMSALGMLFPSPSLAEMMDPLSLGIAAIESGQLPLEQLIDKARSIIDYRLKPILDVISSDDGVDQRWYWAAPALLSKNFAGLNAWLDEAADWTGPDAESEDEGESEANADEPGDVFDEHVQYFRAAMAGELNPPLGRPPDDLSKVLAILAIAGPGVCALRALHRVAPDAAWDDPVLLHSAARVAMGFRTLFNNPDSIALLRGSEDDEAYWRLALEHGLHGNLQSLLDEQVHVLKESLGLMDSSQSHRVRRIAAELADSLSIRAARLGVDEIKAGSKITIKPFNIRCRFALRFAEIKDDQEQTLARVDTVRSAFNSPFRPFVLASTSIGQEGLDFHVWCHALMHWNLPSNPVDLEQREGRVHRFKGHAVRKNIARAYGLAALKRDWDGAGDPWAHLFHRAAAERGVGDNDLIPYWLFETEGGAKIERRVPLMPFSREVQKLERLKKSLALYRLVFGQPRQEDLLMHLGKQIPADDIDRVLAQCQINLMP